MRHMERCRAGYRSGPPRITETMAQQDGGRGTGYLGTGVYFYRSPEGMEKDSSYKRGMPGYEMECPCKNPFILPNNNDRLWRFHDFSRDLVRNIRYKDKPDIENKAMNAYFIARTNGAKVNYEEFVQRAKDAIAETDHCLETEPGWHRHQYQCDQPINHLLGGLGYDCVIAEGEYGDRNDLGCVIFRKPLERCMGSKVDAESMDLKRDCMVRLVPGTPEFEQYEREEEEHHRKLGWVWNPHTKPVCVQRRTTDIDLDLSMLNKDFLRCVGDTTQVVCEKGKCEWLDQEMRKIGVKTIVR